MERSHASTTPARASSAVSPRLTRRRATTRSPSSAKAARRSWKSPHGPTTARSWGCATARSLSRACNSTPSLFSPSMATRCSATSLASEGKTMFTPQEAINRLCDKREIFYDEMVDLMRQVMEGKVTPVQLAAILMGLHVKTESVSEIAAAAAVMREFSTKVDVAGLDHLVDTCGTGGDKAHTFNISTTAAFVAAAAGARVAKHGGRAVSSQSGSADLLEGLGGSLALNAEQVALSIREVGVGFMFAPNHHPAMKHAAPVRKELGIRTILNILGPLTNPAGAPNQLLGVFHPDLVGILARVLQRLQSKHVLVVYGKDGMDEVSLGAATLVGELKDGQIREYEIHPEDFGLRMISNRGLKVADAMESKAMLLEALANIEGTPREIVVLNAGVALYAANVAGSIPDGIERARAVVASGAAQKKLEQFVATTRKLAGSPRSSWLRCLTRARARTVSPSASPRPPTSRSSPRGTSN